MSETKNTLLDIANELTGNRRFDLLKILQTARSRGIIFNLEDVLQLIAGAGHRCSELNYLPEFIPSFVSAYAKNMAPRSILDIWAGIGATIAPIVHEIKLNEAIALERNREAYEIARLLGHETGIEWRLGSPLSMLDEIKQDFDIILGTLPWKTNSPQSIKFQLENKEIKIRDHEDKLLILKASVLLSRKGVGFFIVDPNFPAKSNKHAVYSNLSHFGLFIDAILSLPSGTLPFTSLGGLLVIIRKQRPKQLFVGELSSNKKSNDVVLHNLKARKNGKIPQHGILINSEEFHSFQTLILEYETNELGRQLGLLPTPLKNIIFEINLTKSSDADAFVNYPNAVYLPLIGKSPAVSSLADLRIKPHNYAQIVLKPNEVIAEYLAHFFNTKTGLKIREYLRSGTIIPKITKGQLNKATVYVPDNDIQAEVLQANASIVELSTQLEVLKKQLWERPRKAKEILKSVNSLNQERSFENWLESLPFPLASILWLYHTENDSKDKLDHLLNFFEALSLYNAVLMLSAYASDLGFYTRHFSGWLDTDPQHLDWYRHASFGNWNIIGEHLAKSTRRFLSDEQTRNHCLDLFGQPTFKFMRLLTDKRLFALLKTVGNYRNLWKGHSGYVSSLDSQKRLDTLERELAKIRQLVADHYSTGLLLRADANKYKNGIFYYNVYALMGRSAPFKKVSVKALSPMDTQKLYLLHENQLKPVELLPFIWIADPERGSPAFYFYNRIDQNKARFVSYHFADEPELYRPLSGLEHSFELLKPNNTVSWRGEHEDAQSE